MAMRLSIERTMGIYQIILAILNVVLGLENFHTYEVRIPKRLDPSLQISISTVLIEYENDQNLS